MNYDDLVREARAIAAQLERAEAHAALGGAGTAVRVKDAPYLIEKVTALASAIERLQAELAELAKPVFLACPIDSPANEAEAWRAILDERTKRAAAAIRERTDGR